MPSQEARVSGRSFPEISELRGAANWIPDVAVRAKTCAAIAVLTGADLDYAVAYEITHAIPRANPLRGELLRKLDEDKNGWLDVPEQIKFLRNLVPDFREMFCLEITDGSHKVKSGRLIFLAVRLIRRLQRIRVK